MTTERVTIRMPTEIVEDIDRRARNRSKFILDAVRRELERQRREELRQSLRNPHLDSESVAEMGLTDWDSGLPGETVEDLVDPEGGSEIRWVLGKGWDKGSSELDES